VSDRVFDGSFFPCMIGVAKEGVAAGGPGECIAFLSDASVGEVQGSKPGMNVGSDRASGKR